MFLFRKQQTSNGVEGMLLTHNVKHPASLSSLLTRLGLTQTSSTRTFTAFVTLTLTFQVEDSPTTEHRRSSRMRTLHLYSRQMREEGILTQMSCAGSASLSPRRPGRELGPIRAFQHGSRNSADYFNSIDYSGWFRLGTHEYHTNSCQTVMYPHLMNVW